MSRGKGGGGPTAIVMMNLGGPKSLDEVGPFLLRLFTDREIIPLPFQSVLGPFLARRRTRSVQALYRGIGGGSPILRWTEAQGRGMVERLDTLCPGTAPHRFYVAFRYVEPFSEDALRSMHADGVRRAVAFTQYPHFSCATTGSSLNELWRAARRVGLERAFAWSVLDRWPTHPAFIDAMAATVRRGLDLFEPGDRGDVLILFSAHSLPLSVIKRGDPYPQEIGATVHEVMKRLDCPNRYILAYQSQVGPVPWQGPSTGSVLRMLGEKQIRHVLVVGIAFTTDHIETLSEIDIGYAHVARRVGIESFRRAPAFNDDPLFQDALAHVVADHLRRGEACSTQYGLRCPGCTNPRCRTILNPISSTGQTGP